MFAKQCLAIRYFFILAGIKTSLNRASHGARVSASHANSVNGMSDTICPVDFKTAGMILDYEMNDILVRQLKPGE